MDAIERAFERVVTPAGLKAACENEVPFSWQRSTLDQQVRAIANFELGTTEHGMFYRVEIGMAPAGTYLTRADYDRLLSATQKADQARPEHERIGPFLFPGVGLRALRGVTLGPGGGADSLTFTTADEAFDICITLDNRMRENLPDPGFSCDRLARSICNAYDSTARPPHEP